MRGCWIVNRDIFQASSRPVVAFLPRRAQEQRACLSSLATTHQTRLLLPWQRLLTSAVILLGQLLLQLDLTLDPYHVFLLLLLHKEFLLTLLLFHFHLGQFGFIGAWEGTLSDLNASILPTNHLDCVELGVRVVVLLVSCGALGVRVRVQIARFDGSDHILQH